MSDEMAATGSDDNAIVNVDNAPTDEATEAPEKGSKASRDAARYRTALRDAESRLAASQARIDGYVKRDVESIAAEHLETPGDIFDVAKMSMDALLNDDGEPDVDAIAEACQALTEARPMLAKGHAENAAVSNLFGAIGGVRSEGIQTAPSWTQALRGV